MSHNVTQFTSKRFSKSSLTYIRGKIICFEIEFVKNDLVVVVVVRVTTNSWLKMCQSALYTFV